MAANTNIQIPFVPQTGVTEQILAAITAANEHHFNQQKLNLQQQQLQQTGAYQQSEIANQQQETAIRQRAQDLAEQGFPAEQALRKAQTDVFAAQAAGAAQQTQNRQAMINALVPLGGPPVGGGSPAPTAAASAAGAPAASGGAPAQPNIPMAPVGPTAPPTNAQPGTPNPGPAAPATNATPGQPEPGSALDWATKNVPGHLLGLVSPALNSLTGKLSSDEQAQLAAAMAKAPKSMLELGQQTGSPAGYAAPFSDAVQSIIKDRNTPEGLEKRAATGDPEAQAILAQTNKNAGAKAAAEAGAKFPYELSLKKQELEQAQNMQPAFAVNPQTGQRELTTFGDAKQNGLTNPIKVSQAQVEQEATLNSQLNDLQLNTSRYKAALNRMSPLSSTDVANITHILATPDVHNAILQGAGMPAVMSMIEQGGTARDWNALSPDKQDAVMGALRMKNSAILFQKVTSGTGRVSDEAMQVEIANMPSPIEGATVGNKKLQAFQENIDQIAGRSVKLPFMPTPQDVKSKLEKQATDQYNEDQANTGSFKGDVYVLGKGTATPKAGDTVIVHNQELKVSKTYPNGTFDAK